MNTKVALLLAVFILTIAPNGQSQKIPSSLVNHFHALKTLNGGCDAFAHVIDPTFSHGPTNGDEIDICKDIDDEFYVKVSCCASTIGDLKWLVTLQDFTIMEIKQDPSFNFKDYPEDLVYIMLVAHIGDLQGLEVGLNLFFVTGCGDLSDNLIEVRLHSDCGPKLCTDEEMIELPSWEEDFSNRWVKNGISISGNSIQGYVNLRSEQFVELKPEFEILEGAAFIANVAECELIDCISSNSPIINNTDFLQVGETINIYDIVEPRCNYSYSFSPTNKNVTDYTVTCSDFLQTTISIYEYYSALPFISFSYPRIFNTCDPNDQCLTCGTPDPSLGFACRKLVKSLEQNGQVSFFSYEILLPDLNAYGCDMVAAFSNDWTDIRRDYDCNDIGDIQVVMYIFKVTSRDPCTNAINAVEFLQNCFTIQTIIDTNSVCN